MSLLHSALVVFAFALGLARAFDLPYPPSYHQHYWNPYLLNGQQFIPQQLGGIQPRQNMFGLSGMNTALSPLTSLINRMPPYLIPNPDTLLPTRSYEPCTDSNGDKSGVCMSSLTCSNSGGKASGSCGGMFGNVCCLNTVSKCGSRITLNNTYWTQSSLVDDVSTCGVTVVLDSNLIEQNRRVCQVRLDFLSFSISQPNNQTQCATDTFQVGGTVNRVPVICGDNAKQHMYLQPASSTSELHLLFTFGTSITDRSWLIKVSLLPCGASYLAPNDCLQYFTQPSGTVMSFNWKDIDFTANRQLANQDYRVCFRSERVLSKVSDKVCFSPCSVQSNAKVFGLSSLATPRSGVKHCSSDYLIVNSGYDPNSSLSPEENVWDRYCGEYFNVDPSSSQHGLVCTNLKPYSIHYYTDNSEESVASFGRMDSGDTGTGFCLKFQQSAN